MFSRRPSSPFMRSFVLRWSRLACPTFAIMSLIMGGCQSADPPDTDASLDDQQLEAGSVIELANPNVVETATPNDAVDDTLHEWDWQRVQQEVQNSSNRVVVVNIWTNTCAVCLSEYPDFVMLTKRFPAEQVEFIDVNCDYDGVPDKPVSFYHDQVIDQLKEHQSRSRHVMLTDPFFDFLDANDFHSTPIVLVYDQDGKLARQFDNHDVFREEDEFHMADVGSKIVELLASDAE